jgi:flavin-dependent dehydrogenase
MVVTGEHGARIRGAYGDGVYGLSILRRDLDHYLLDAAVKAGARVEEGVLVRGPLVDHQSSRPHVRGIVVAGKDGRDVRIPAPLVIAADGRRSRLAIGLGLLRTPERPRRWAIGAYFESVAGMSGCGEMHIRGGRYLGVAPVPSGLANVCWVSESHAGLADPAGALWAAIRATPEVAARCAEARMVTRPSLMGPLAVDAAACGVPGLLLAGDAAGFIDPMTGDGLRFAIVGGELAARAALGGLADGRAAHVRLSRWRREAFGRKQRFNRLLRALVSRPSGITTASAAARIAPWTVRRLVAVAGDVGR